MNVSPRNLKKTGTNNHKHKTNKLMAKFKVVILILMPLAAAFAIINYRIALNEKVNLLERERIMEEERVKYLELEIENLQVKRASLRSWSHIRKKLVQFKIDLQLPFPGQVVALNVIGENQLPDEHIASRNIQTPTVASR
jgi:predicted outer membrane lipoprotein